MQPLLRPQSRQSIPLRHIQQRICATSTTGETCGADTPSRTNALGYETFLFLGIKTEHNCGEFHTTNKHNNANKYATPALLRRGLGEFRRSVLCERDSLAQVEPRSWQEAPLLGRRAKCSKQQFLPAPKQDGAGKAPTERRPGCQASRVWPHPQDTATYSR